MFILDYLYIYFLLKMSPLLNVGVLVQRWF